MDVRVSRSDDLLHDSCCCSNPAPLLQRCALSSPFSPWPPWSTSLRPSSATFRTTRHQDRKMPRQPLLHSVEYTLAISGKTIMTACGTTFKDDVKKQLGGRFSAEEQVISYVSVFLSSTIAE
ncbi:hypothetical protein L596_021848 [Steinernema carpocapsae]|uniref:Uncharacterized protein n=1 Tax=Steinernema carpocapsae TaxID=34508 RepID=A0A4U5MK12_STECR|nr:hypothetical protein L596_021848 [Steinernema carpocapsae]